MGLLHHKISSVGCDQHFEIGNNMESNRRKQHWKASQRVRGSIPTFVLVLVSQFVSWGVM